MSFGTRLIEIREHAKNGKKMGRGDFAPLLGITPTQLRNFELELKTPTPDELKMMKAHLLELGASVDGEGEQLALPLYDTMPTLEQRYDEGTTWEPAIEHVVADEEDEEEDGLDVQPMVGTVYEVRPVQTLEPRIVLDTSDGIRRFANSEIQTFKRCKRKWWLAWYRNLKLRVEDVTGARAIGNRVHRALAAYYVPEGMTPLDPRDALERAITEDWTRIHAALTELGQEVPPELAKQFTDDTALERIMVEGYLEWLAETGKDQGIKVVASETYLEAPIELQDRVVKLIGKVDVRVTRDLDGARLFLDHKTVGDLTRPVKTLHMNEQMLHYHLLEWLNHLGEPGRATGALYNMLRKVKRTDRANPPFYDRVEIHHNDLELQNFYVSTVATVIDILMATDRLNQGIGHHVVAYPRKTGDCAWDCDFFAICPMFDDGSRAEDMISAYFVEGDPLAYYKEEKRNG